jgi:hypothetical protein
VIELTSIMMNTIQASSETTRRSSLIRLRPVRVCSEQLEALNDPSPAPL